MKKYIKDFKKKIFKRSACVFCGEETRWFHRKNYYNPYDKAQKYPICKKCKDRGLTAEDYDGRSSKPCKNHKKAFSSPDIPEAKDIQLKQCKKCGYYLPIKKDRPCKNHPLAFTNPDVPEAKNIELRKCKKCEFWIENNS